MRVLLMQDVRPTGVCPSSTASSSSAAATRPASTAWSVPDRPHRRARPGDARPARPGDGVGRPRPHRPGRRPPDVPIANTPDVLTEATADLTFALLLAAARRLGEAERYLRGGRWREWLRPAARHRCPRQDAGGDRLGPHRPGGRPPRRGLLDADGRGRPRPRRARAGAGRSRLRRRHRAADRRDQAPDRPAEAGVDEARRDPCQHQPRAGRGRGGAGGCPRLGRPRRRRPGRVRARAAVRPALLDRRTPCSCRTSARRRTRRATAWRRWPAAASRRSSGASGRRTWRTHRCGIVGRGE